jgi:triphosphatase
MEIELKYLIDDRRKIPEILADEQVRELAEDRQFRHVPMHAIYYDTAEQALLKQKVVFRVRKEGNQQVATIKWGGGARDGMHRREEVNVAMSGNGSTPDLTVFRGEGVWDLLAPVVEEHALLPLMTMDFMRQEVELRKGKTRCMLSVDLGEIIVGANKSRIPGFSEETVEGVNQARIQELEIELIEGEETVIREIGETLAEKYGLRPGDISKFQRGYALIK